MRRWLRLVITVTAIVMTASSCASINVESLPQPGTSYDDGYDIYIEFSNVLNLPERAKVVLDGRPVGVVTDVTTTSQQARVTARIDPNVKVPSDIHAAMQQATVLGDIYVALQRSATDDRTKPAMARGATIPLAQSTSPPQLEDTIASMANFVSSGSIQRLQNTIIGINRVQPAGGDAAIRKMASQVATNLSDLSNNMEDVDGLLTAVSGTADTMHKLRPIYADWFTPSGLAGFYRNSVAASAIGTLLPSLGSIYSGGFWLVPLLKSLGDAVGALQSSKWSFEQEVPAWRRIFTDSFLPQDNHPAINITQIIGPDGKDLTGNVQDVLRIIGGAP